MTTISPSILSADYLNLKKEIEAFDHASDLSFHLDIMDGHYVPNLTFGKVVLKDIHKITKHKLDAHFMVTNPEDYLEPFSTIGIYNFTFHWEVVSNHLEMIKKIKKLYPSAGMSLNPETDIKDIPDQILKELDLLLIMSVSPGFGGQSFKESTYDKLEYIQNKIEELQLEIVIQVDGGVNEQNSKKLRSLGATNLVAGSFIFKSDNYLEQIAKLRK